MTPGSGKGTTLFVGAPTRLGIALNDFVRLNGAALRAGGVESRPNRLVTPALRAAMGGTDVGVSLDAVMHRPPDMALFLSAIHAMGRPSTAVRKGELFPEAERMLAGAARALAGRVDRVVLAVEPVHFLIMAVGQAEFHERVRGTRWEVLYDVSWADLVVEVKAGFAQAEVVVLTPYAVTDGAGPVLHLLFGSPGFGLAAEAAGEALLSAARVSYEADDIKDKTGIDRVTIDLLTQRFNEDMNAMAAMDGVRVM